MAMRGNYASVSDDGEKTKKMVVAGIAGVAIVGVVIWLGSYYGLFGGDTAKPVAPSDPLAGHSESEVKDYKKAEDNRAKLEKQHPSSGS